MTLLHKRRGVAMLVLMAGMAPAWGFARQDQSPAANQMPASAGANSRAQTTPPAPSTAEGPTAPGADQPATHSDPKTRGKKSKKATSTESGKVVVSNGGAKEQDNQLAPAMSKEQAVRERQNISQLLATTDANLKSIAGRQLTPSQQNMLAQIHSYVNQSKTASDAGDLARANTLASKAHLLSDELVKK